MSKEIDEKVVSMKFDNKHFMDNTAETMTRLEKLKASLRLSGASKGLEDVNRAAGDVKLSPLGTAAEQVGIKFNALQVMATTALMNITNSAVNAGKRIASALTIEPIKMGFSECPNAKDLLGSSRRRTYGFSDSRKHSYRPAHIE